MPSQQQQLNLIASLNAYLSSTAEKLSQAAQRMQSGQLLSNDELDGLIKIIADYSSQHRYTLQQLASVCPKPDSIEALTQAVRQHFDREAYLYRFQSITADPAYAAALARLQQTIPEALSDASSEQFSACRVFFSILDDPQADLPDEQLDLLSSIFPVSVLRILFQGGFRLSGQQADIPARPSAQPERSQPERAPEPEIHLSLPANVSLGSDGAYLMQDLSNPNKGSFRSVNFNRQLNSVPATRQILTLAARLMIFTRERLTELLPSLGARRLDEALTLLVNSGLLEKVRFYTRESEKRFLQSTNSETSEHVFYILADYCINSAAQAAIRRQLVQEFTYTTAQEVYNTLSDSLLSYQRCTQCGEFMLTASALSKQIKCQLTSRPAAPWCCAEAKYGSIRLVFFPLLFHGSQTEAMLTALTALLRNEKKNRIILASDTYLNAQYWQMELLHAGAPMDRIFFEDLSVHQLYTSDFHKLPLSELIGLPASDCTKNEAPDADEAAEAAPQTPDAEPETSSIINMEAEPAAVPETTPVQETDAPSESDFGSDPAFESEVPEPSEGAVLTPEAESPSEPEEQPAPEPEALLDSVPAPEAEAAEQAVPEAPPETAEPEQAEPQLPQCIDAAHSIFPPQEPTDFEIHSTALSLFADRRFDCGLLMLKSACRLDSDRYEPAYRRFAYALNDPLAHCVYRFDRLQEIYDTEGSRSCSTLAFCAYLRMLFSEDIRGQAGYEYLIQEPSISALCPDGLYDAAPELRSVIYDLCHIFAAFHRGFDPYLIRLTREAADFDQRLSTLQQAARNLLEAGLDHCNTSMSLLADLRIELFGASGTLMRFLRAVAANDKSRAEEIQTYCGRFLRSKISSGAYTEDSFDKNLLGHHINSVFATLEGYRHSNIVGGPRNSVLNHLCKVMTVCINWAAIYDEGQITDQSELQLISQTQEQLNRNLTVTEEKLRALPLPEAAEERAAHACLIQTVHEMLARVQNRFPLPQEFYLDFLTGEQVELNPETGLPELEEAVSIIPGYELWRRVYRHASEPHTPDSIRSQIYRPDGSNSFDFGRAQLYRSYLSRHQLPDTDWDGIDIEADEQSVRQLLNGWITKFEANLELADSYGRLEVGNKDRIMLEIEQSYLPHAKKSGNFGFFRRATAAYLRAVDNASKKLRSEVLHRLEQLESEKGALPITQTIRTLIDSGKYSVASDYIRLADDEGYQQAPADGMLLESDRRDYLAEFLKDYNQLFQQYYYPNTLFERCYSELHPQNQDHNKQLRSARLFVGSWPKGSTSLGSPAELLTQLGFRPSEVADSGPLVRTVQLSPPDCRIPEYAHPIAGFGTRLSETGLQVNYLFGRFNCETLMSRLRSLGTSLRPVLVILDYALTLPERRQLAFMLKREGANLRTMLLIDRVLAAYLTQFDAEERGIAMLQCTLPFHYYNPYFENPQAIIPPEMFMGRRQELQAIVESGRCSMIYGGRQLGKTALLHRARYLCDDRANGSWSLYIDIKNDDRDSAASHILSELARPEFGFLPEPPEDGGWQQLSDAIRTRMNDPERPVNRLLLLLDEADHFLNSSAQDGYLGVETLAALQTQTGDRFKFVFAGLHNVQRFHTHATEHNSKLAHLTSMAVKPLSYADASQLLEMPLYYLGFRMKPEQNALISQVLSSCNYYPGLIHFYCSKLISRLSERSSGISGEPPYYLGDDQIRMLIQDKTFGEQIREKFFITLQVDEQEYYQILSYALACCYHEYPSRAISGFTSRDILEICETFGIRSITELTLTGIEALMRELEELNILRSANEHYFFNRRNFRNMLGSKDRVWAALEAYGEESK